MNTGQKIKLLRERYGYTLEELGNRVGVGKSTVRKWENGMIANMGRDKIAKLAEVFNVSPNYLINDEDASEEELPEVTPESEIDKAKKILFQTLVGATEEEILQAAKIIEALKKK